MEEIISDLCRRLYQGKGWDESLAEPLRALGFAEPKTAWNIVTILARHCHFPELFPRFFPTLFQVVADSYHADLALANFERFAAKIPDKDHFYSRFDGSLEFLHALVTLFSGSQLLTDALHSDPSHIDWLMRPETLNKSRTRDDFMRQYHGMAGQEYNTGKVPSLLRRFKRREYIRIGLRDLLGKAEFEETARDVSHLADVCLQVAYEYADHECRKKYGAPRYQDADGNEKNAEFAVLGMGKLGGGELNFSSDIDLIYIYSSSKGETGPDENGSSPILRITTHEYFTRLALLLTRTVNDITSDGNVFRVDLNLRPEGRSGEIVNSLASCEIYYQSWGRTWERQALLKARVCAGSEALGAEFFEIIQPFVYRRSLDYSAVQEIKAMKDKIDESLKGKKGSRGNIKLGFGGIREIEFMVQSYQLLFGGRDKSLRIANTLEVLKRLRERALLTQHDHDRLRASYIFLRNLENRVQISFGLQTHILPEDPAQLTSLARKMRIEAENPRNLAPRLMEEFDRHRQFVNRMFSSLFKEEKKEQAERAHEQWEGKEKQIALSEEALTGIGFSDPKRICKFLESLRNGPQFSHPSEKSLQQFDAILPQILEYCRKVAKPASGVENLVKFIEASGARETYLSLFHQSEKLLELLLILCGGSDYLSNTLIKQPDLVDILMDLESVYRFKPPERIREELDRMLQTRTDLEGRKLALRRFKQGEELRIGIRYLIREVNILGTVADLSSLADVFMQTVTQTAIAEIQARSAVGTLPDDFAVIAMGKHGGRELNFGSDLDVLFVYDESEGAPSPLASAELVGHYASISQMIFQLTSAMTPAGVAYKIDTDLRPEGNQGVLVLSVQGYRDYFQSRARVWEQQAMTRARFIAGSERVGERFIQAAHDFTYRKKFEYGSLIEISRLRERMEKELAQEARKGKNVKLGYGGLADIEFTVQILQLMHGSKYPRLRQTNTREVIRICAAVGLLDQDAADRLKENFLFLRNLECALRILNPFPTNHLPSDEDSLAALARLLGHSGTNEELTRFLDAEYTRITGEIRTFYRKMMGGWLRTSL